MAVLGFAFLGMELHDFATMFGKGANTKSLRARLT
jgi:heme/copper-type cytochrome/quinol oxidase subunit 3